MTEQRNPTIQSDKLETDAQKQLAWLATQQGVSPVTNFDDLMGDFWPEDESADEFISTVKEWRHEGDE